MNCGDSVPTIEDSDSWDILTTVEVIYNSDIITADANFKECEIGIDYRQCKTTKSMKKTILFLFLISISCKSIQEISGSGRENIISELNYIGNIDQKYSGAAFDELISKYGKEVGWKKFEEKRDSVIVDNLKRIKNLYSKYGYLGYSQVGKENSIKFWLPIQHSDNDVKFQQKMLKSLRREVNKKNASKSNYAMLEDRIAINLNKKQRFGTQVTYSENGQAIPKNGLIDAINIDKLRAEYDLESFKEYYNWMSTDHFEMNKEYFLNKGLTKPLLYD